MNREALEQLSQEQLIELVLGLLQRVADLEARIAELTGPPKTPDNSSTPPSRGRKANAMRPTPAKAGGRRRGRPGVARALHPDPNRVIDAVVETCPHCRAVMPAAAQRPHGVYDRIELPPSVPDVTRVRLFGGRCACCGRRVVASAPPGLEPGSPFGKSIAALVVYLHYAHAIGLARLKVLLDEVFGLQISEGGLCNLMARAGKPLAAETAAIAEQVKAARVVCSDETSARVNGRNHWEWVFVTAQAVLHRIRPSRAKAVPQELFGAIKPGVWVSDMLGSQRGHAREWQVCLAHLLRDAQYVIDWGDNAFGTAFKRLGLARHCHRATARRPEGHDAAPIPGGSRSKARPHPRDPTRDQGRKDPAQAAGQGSRPSLPLRYRPPGAVHQQRLRAKPPTICRVPQGHQRVPLGLGY
jgi:transposase